MNHYGMEQLLEVEGFDEPIELLEAYQDEGAVPCICTHCGMIEYWEPDARDVLCLQCGRRTVQSCFVLMGVI